MKGFFQETLLLSLLSVQGVAAESTSVIQFLTSPAGLISILFFAVSLGAWFIFFAPSNDKASSLFRLNSSLQQSTAKADQYAEFFDESKQVKVDERKNDYTTVVNHYYDLVTDFYEWGWGECFHFAPRYRGETARASFARHEHKLAMALKLKKGQKVLDVGCGVGGPMREIARFSRANVTGINNNAYQIQRGKVQNKSAGLDKLCDFIKCDFMHMPVPDNSQDAVYAIEATCHAPSKVGIYSEIFRVLKPGGEFAAFEWCMTSKYDPKSAEHRAIKLQIEAGDGIPDLDVADTVVQALKEAGFEILEVEDCAIPDELNPIPWYQDFVPGLSLSGFKLTKLGRAATYVMVSFLETLYLIPKGSSKTQATLIKTADALVEGGQKQIFTPSYFFHVRKPLQ